jgi:deazaflavin-dependent oxidoreductase (nitroreductase family)
MPEDGFANALQRRRQISITVTGRRTGRAITIPVWFVSDERGLSLLPVSGSKTQWYRNLQKNRAMTIHASVKRRDLRARLLKDKRAVSAVIRQFREKYTSEEVKRWYSGSTLRYSSRSSLRLRREASGALPCRVPQIVFPLQKPARACLHTIRRIECYRGSFQTQPIQLYAFAPSAYGSKSGPHIAALK